MTHWARGKCVSMLGGERGEAALPELRGLAGEGPTGKNSKAALSTAGAEAAGSRQGRPVLAMSHSEGCRPLSKNKKPLFFTLN